MSFDVPGDINYFAVAVAAIVYFAIGAIWYAPAVMGRAWQRAAGLPEDPANPSPMLFVLTFAAYFLWALTLAAIAANTGASSLGEGVVLGLFVGIGVVAMELLVNGIYTRRRTLAWINMVNGIIGTVTMAIIVTVWD